MVMMIQMRIRIRKIIIEKRGKEREINKRKERKGRCNKSRRVESGEKHEEEKRDRKNSKIEGRKNVYEKKENRKRKEDHK